ncbi:subclass B1 metallo-beta-lactamase [Chitinimonas sp. BJB300]|uniref:subclass B1 metallo-beta-lactamase n=1 Tax=Chitinimonas sp. BJB300 TaxID=1559339 RepID=UPI0013041F31|nr:subclass B1 metallo-beta-lactamase [Chitinimonas sp. BJB300]
MASVFALLPILVMWWRFNQECIMRAIMVVMKAWQAVLGAKVDFLTCYLDRSKDAELENPKKALVKQGKTGDYFIRRFFIAITGLFLATPALAQGVSDEIILHPDVHIVPLAHNVWRHVTYEVIPDGRRIPSNGLIIKTDKGVTLVDTGWKIEHTQMLLDWVKSNLREPVTAGVVSHSHRDRMGGIDVWLRNDIPVYGSFLTADIAKRNGLQPPNRPFVFAARLSEEIELYYPGPGHSIDNIIVWLPKSKILFGGCLIKSADAAILEPVDGSNVVEWSGSVFRLKDERFNAEIVVPGHGEPGTLSLVDHTIRLGSMAKPI